MVWTADNLAGVNIVPNRKGELRPDPKPEAFDHLQEKRSMRSRIDAEMELPIEMHRGFHILRVGRVLHETGECARLLDFRLRDILGGLRRGETLERHPDEAQFL